MAEERPFEDKAKPKTGFLNLGTTDILVVGGSTVPCSMFGNIPRFYSLDIPVVIMSRMGRLPLDENHWPRESTKVIDESPHLLSFSCSLPNCMVSLLHTVVESSELCGISGRIYGVV